jgi:hypothetical protein
MYVIFWLENLQGRDHLEDRHRWEDIRMDIMEIGCEGVKWTHLARDRNQWKCLINTVMNLQVPQNVGNFFTT